MRSIGGGHMVFARSPLSLSLCDECIIFLLMSSARSVDTARTAAVIPLVARLHVDLCHCNGDLCTP